MTPDIDSIRARDATPRLPRPDFSIVEYRPGLGDILTRKSQDTMRYEDEQRWRREHPEWDDLMQAEDDRRALLAEVDRLTADAESLTRKVGLALLDVLEDRRRIRAAVEGLPCYDGWADTGWFVDRAAVLAAIDGDA